MDKLHLHFPMAG